MFSLSHTGTVCFLQALKVTPRRKKQQKHLQTFSFLFCLRCPWRLNDGRNPGRMSPTPACQSGRRGKKGESQLSSLEFLAVKLVLGGRRAPYLSAAAFWCVLTTLFVTDGVPRLNSSCCLAAEVMERGATSWQMEHQVSDWLFFYLRQNGVFVWVCVDKVFCNHLWLCVLCLCIRPFPSEDTALNEDDVYRSLEELAE